MTAQPWIRRVHISLALATLVACGSDGDGGTTEPPGPTRLSLNGGWGATIHFDGTDVGSRGDILFCLTDANGVISGTGFVTDRQVASVTVSITGTYEPPHLLLTLDNPEDPITIDATVEANPGVDGAPLDMVGILDGWVFDKAPVDIGWGPSCGLAPGAVRRE